MERRGSNGAREHGRDAAAARIVQAAALRLLLALGVAGATAVLGLVGLVARSEGQSEVARAAAAPGPALVTATAAGTVDDAPATGALRTDI